MASPEGDKQSASTFRWFLKQCYNEHRTRHPNAKNFFRELKRRCAEKWQAIPEDEKQLLMMLAKMKRRQANRDKNQVKKAEGNTPLQKKVKIVKPRKPLLSPFEFFRKEVRGGVREEHWDWKAPEVNAEVRAIWHNMTPEKRRPFVEQSVAAKAARAQKMDERSGKNAVTNAPFANVASCSGAAALKSGNASTAECAGVFVWKSGRFEYE